MATTWLADDQAIADVVARESRFRARARRMHDAADHVMGGNRRSNRTIGIDRREPHACLLAAKFMKEPPWDSIHGSHYDGVAIEQRRNRRCDAGQRRSLQGDDNEFLGPQLTRPFGDACWDR